MRDVQVYQPTIDPQANERYGAFAVGQRDELVTALGLSVLDSRYSTQMLLEDMRAWADRVQAQATQARAERGYARWRHPWGRFS